MSGDVRLHPAGAADKAFWFTLDTHISEEEFLLKTHEGRAYIIKDSEKPIGVLRYGLFWDNTPFLNMLYIEEKLQGKGYGRRAMALWEAQRRTQGFPLAMTSSLATEGAQHFYRKLGYADAGCLLLDTQPTELFFTKKL